MDSAYFLRLAIGCVIECPTGAKIIKITVLYFQEQNGASARIIDDSDSSDSSSSYTVIVEKEVVCQTTTFLRAMELLMVVHYAFNLVYN